MIFEMNIQDTLQEGTILNGRVYSYKIEKILGQGSFGVTYLATADIEVSGPLGKINSTIQVAIKEFFMKELNGRDGSTVTCSTKGGLYEYYKGKFAREAENLGSLKHPNIVKVLEWFEANNTYYYAMEYCEAGSLDSLIQQGCGLSQKESLEYIMQIGDALQYMHDNKMLHLDMKPSNVMLRKKGEAVLIDFGLSKQYTEDGAPESSTTIGGGTPGYAPVEQANYQDGKGFPVTMDVYALGATLYKMLTGVRPEVSSVILNGEFPEQKLKSRGIGEELIAAIKKAMAPLVKERYKSVREFMEALPKIAGTSVSNVDDESTTFDEDVAKKRRQKTEEGEQKEKKAEKQEVKKVVKIEKSGGKSSKILKLALILPAVAVVVLGLLYSIFVAEPKDSKLYWEALHNDNFELMESLANKGYSDACNSLGCWYYNATGPIKAVDIDKARIWFEKGAKLGDCSSAYDAAQIYEMMARRASANDSTGFGGAENLWNLAEEYYELALKNLQEMDNGKKAPRNNISRSFSHYSKEKIEEELADCRKRR